MFMFILALLLLKCTQIINNKIHEIERIILYEASTTTNNGFPIAKYQINNEISFILIWNTHVCHFKSVTWEFIVDFCCFVV